MKISLLSSIPPSSTLFPYTTLFRSPISVPCRARLTAGPFCSPRSSVESDLTSLTIKPIIFHKIMKDTYSIYERSEEHTSELQSHSEHVCRLLLEKKNKISPIYA